MAALPGRCLYAHTNHRNLERGNASGSLMGPLLLQFECTGCCAQVVKHAVMAAAARQVLADDKQSTKEAREGVVSPNSQRPDWSGKLWTTC